MAHAAAAYHELAQRALIRVPLMTKPYRKVFGIQAPAGQAHYWLELAAHRRSRPVPAAGPRASLIRTRSSPLYSG